MAQLHVAVVGAGPAGIFAAELLTHGLPAGTRVDLIDSPVAPVGLNAAMHTFPETMRYVGNLTVGAAPECDITLAELRDAYDAVVYTDPALADGGPYPTAEQLIAAARAGQITAKPTYPLVELAITRGLPVTLWHGTAGTSLPPVREPAEWRARIERAAGAPVCI